MDEGRERKVPETIRVLHGDWERKRKQSTVYRVVFIAGAFISSLFAAWFAGVASDWRGLLAALLAALFSGLTAVFRPNEEYLKFARAWRVLNSIRVRYEMGSATVEDLAAAMDRGEAIIGESDQDIYRPRDR